MTSCRPEVGLVCVLIFVQVGLLQARELRIGFLPSYSDAKNQESSKYDVGAIAYAVNDINNDPQRLQGHTLTYIYNDTRDHLLTTLKGMTSQYESGALAFIGPEDSCETVASVAAAWNVPMITYVSDVISRAPSRCHPSLIVRGFFLT